MARARPAPRRGRCGRLLLRCPRAVHMDNWTIGRIALVGVAAYCPSPLTGLGTSLALVGAYVLAGELTAHPDHRPAFTEYETIVRPYVDAGQKLPPGGIRAYAPQSQRAIWAR